MRGGRKGWKDVLHVVKTNYNFDRRIPLPFEEPRCILKDAAESHIIVN